ncbi:MULTISPECIES: SDR family NAD(P)-dependent oxidoreductase [unclassified Haladaptatus]|uniref:SDR family NAD(P)-dependent oxidoreductase n=1 Tax=unclassified Haladaptatus TaxID=2622732 RepID=UPI0023E7B013|nr:MULTISPECIES: SDR family oxidoreductase [unclassified Haladaptatus]
MSETYTHTPVSVRDKTAVVIGGTSGIGRGIALGYAAEGANVVATSRTQEKVERVAGEIRDQGAKTLEVTCDVSDRESLETLYDAVEDEFGGADILVNSPSAIARKSVLDVSEEEWAHVLDIQLNGVYRASQVFARRMDAGNIINIASLSSVVTIKDLIAYSTAKGGIDSFTKAAAKELAPDIRVNAIRPGFIETPQTADAYHEGSERYREVTERAVIPRIGQPEDLVGAAIYLASDAAGYTTGEIVTIDGGFTASAFE